MNQYKALNSRDLKRLDTVHVTEGNKTWALVGIERPPSRSKKSKFPIRVTWIESLAAQLLAWSATPDCFPARGNSWLISQVLFDFRPKKNEMLLALKLLPVKMG